MTRLRPGVRVWLATTGLAAAVNTVALIRQEDSLRPAGYRVLFAVLPDPWLAVTFAVVAVGCAVSWRVETAWLIRITMCVHFFLSCLFACSLGFATAVGWTAATTGATTWGTVAAVTAFLLTRPFGVGHE